jgi:hypothetical protein
MAHTKKSPAQPRNPFLDRAQHFANTARGLVAYQCANRVDRATVRALLTMAVRAGVEQ